MTMMKIIDKFLSAAVLMAVIVLFASCSGNDSLAGDYGQTSGSTESVSLTATLDETMTRAGMSKDSDNANKALFYWHKGDLIFVQTQTSDGACSGAKFYTTDDTGASTATFWSESLSGATVEKYAVYPYNEAHKFTDAATLTYHLPATYTYTTVGSEIFSNSTEGTYPVNSTNIPLLGTIADGKVAFKYLGGLVVIRIDKMPYESGTLTVSADQQLSGDFSVDLSESDAAIATKAPDVAVDKQVTFTFSGATKNGVGVFYLPLATGDYTNVTIKVSDGTNTQTVPYGTLSMSSANVWAISLTTHDEGLRNMRSLGDGRYMIGGHVFVDLGLPSGTLWAETNVGAETAADYGYYFAWGETSTKAKYDWTTYKYGSDSSQLTKYNLTDGKTVLDKEDDAASVNWGGFCSIPTREELVELLANCSSMWLNRKDSKGSSIKGYELTSLRSGKSIFLPAAGYYGDQELNNAGENGACYYWPNQLNSGFLTADCLYRSENSTASKTSINRCFGCSVRPVVDRGETLTTETIERMNSTGFLEGWE